MGFRDEAERPESAETHQILCRARAYAESVNAYLDDRVHLFVGNAEVRAYDRQWNLFAWPHGVDDSDRPFAGYDAAYFGRSAHFKTFMRIGVRYGNEFQLPVMRFCVAGYSVQNVSVRCERKSQRNGNAFDASSFHGNILAEIHRTGQS